MLCILFRYFLKLLDTVPYNLIFIVMFIPIPSELIFHLIRVYDAIPCIHIIECMQSSLLVNIVSIYQSLKIWVTVRLLCHFNAAFKRVNVGVFPVYEARSHSLEELREYGYFTQF